MTTSENTTAPTESKAAPQVGRNEPCPCGSGKKYKRCHGVDAAPKLSEPKANPMAAASEGMGAPGAATGALAGFDPSQMDPAMMAQMSNALQRLPRGQLQKLQNIMARAMKGQDVTREAAEFERMLPPELKAMAMGLNMQAAAAQQANVPMSEEEAKRIVAEAAAKGKLSGEQTQDLLGADAEALVQSAEKDAKKWWKFGKKD